MKDNQNTKQTECSSGYINQNVKSNTCTYFSPKNGDMKTKHMTRYKSYYI